MALPSRKLPPLAALLELPDLELQGWLARAERTDLITALTDPVWAGLKTRVLANLPSGARHILEDEWAYRHPDAEATPRAQHALLTLAADLDEAGILALTPPRSDWVTVASGPLHLDDQLEAVVAALDENDLRWALAKVDRETLTRCLFAASPAMKGAFYNQMSARAGAMMEEEIGFLGRLSLAELEAARELLWAVLAESGEPRL
jgi:flagellar motor switch protein FliG